MLFGVNLSFNGSGKDFFEISLLFLIGIGGFLPAMKQIGNVAALPGIVKVCLMFIA